MLQVSEATVDGAVHDAREALSSGSLGRLKSLGLCVPGGSTNQLSPNRDKKFDTAAGPVAQTWKAWEH